MPKKKTYEEVKQYIEQESESGCKLLSTDYQGNKVKLDIQCKCGNKFKTRLNDFKNSNVKQCKSCSGRNEWDINKVRNFVDKNTDAILLSSDYINFNTKMEFECRCGSKFEKTFNDVYYNLKATCRKCSIAERASSQKYNLEDVANYIEDNSNCKLLNESITDISTDILHIQCRCGGVFESKFSYFRGGKRECHECRNKCRREQTYERVKVFINNKGCKLLSNEYTDAKTELKIRCSCGEIFYMNWNCFNQGQDRCIKCSRRRGGSKIRNSYDEVKEIIENGSSCLLISKNYEGSDRPLKIKCGCGSIFRKSLNGFRTSKKKCDKCSKYELKEKRRKENISSVQEVKEKEDIDVQIIGYKDFKSRKITFKCRCGELFLAYPKDFKNGKHSCSDCTYRESQLRRRMTHDEFVQKVNERHPKDAKNIVFLNTYESNSSIVKTRCLKHNIVSEAKAGYIISRGSSCRKCSTEKRSKVRMLSHKDFVESVKAKNKSADSLEFVTNYKGRGKTIKAKCKCCSYEWERKPYYFTYQGFGCPICEGRYSNNHEFLEKLKKVNLNYKLGRIEVLTKFDSNLQQRMECRCKLHDYKWTPVADSLMQGKGCPICSKSQGELKIYDLLRQNNVEFEDEKTFNGCRNKKALPFDFCIKHNDKNLLIEFDGEQHYLPKFGEDNFKKVIHNDKIKN